VSYQTAYLKAHYPVEFLAALMTWEMDDTDKVIKNLAECRLKGIEVLAPDVNESGSDFTPVGDKIRFGLAAVKNVGGKAVEVILDSRRKDGPFASLFDFCRRVDLTAVNRRVIESLIKCGAFDTTTVARARMMAALDEAMRAGQAHQRDRESNQIDIFAVLGVTATGGTQRGDIYPPAAAWSEQEALAFEKEALGFYITGHPLDKFERVIKKITSGFIAALKERAAPGEVALGGVVSALKLRNTKKGDRYGTFNLEDKSGFLEIIAWPDVYKKCAELLAADDPIFVKGRLEAGEERIQIIASEITSLAQAAAKGRANGNGLGDQRREVETLHLHARESEISPDELARLRDMLLEFPGGCAVFLHLYAAGRSETVIELSSQVRVAATPELEASVEKHFGPRLSLHALANWTS
jgi:DNA polymerase-3 subunit alpha